MKKLFIIFGLFLYSYSLLATIHVVKVWDGYMQFVNEEDFSNSITIQLGDTVQWLPLDEPFMVHTITSTNIPDGAASFDQIWQAPADTFFQYIPMLAGLYEYECTPHASSGMIGSINVIDSSTEVDISSIDNNLFYPNPVRDVINFKEYDSTSSYVIYNNNGQVLMAGKLEKEIDVSNFSSGVYYLQMDTKESNVYKLIKE